VPGLRPSSSLKPVDACALFLRRRGTWPTWRARCPGTPGQERHSPAVLALVVLALVVLLHQR